MLWGWSWEGGALKYLELDGLGILSGLPASWSAFSTLRTLHLANLPGLSGKAPASWLNGPFISLVNFTIGECVQGSHNYLGAGCLNEQSLGGVQLAVNDWDVAECLAICAVLSCQECVWVF